MKKLAMSFIFSWVLIFPIGGYLIYKHLNPPCEQTPDEILNGTIIGCLMTLEVPSIGLNLERETCSLLEREVNCELYQEDREAMNIVIKKYVQACIKDTLKKDNFCFDTEKVNGIFEK